MATLPLLPEVLRGLNLLEDGQYEFIRFAREHLVEYGDASKRLPLPPGSVDVLYSSHMLEHLDREEAMAFLNETRRVLRPGGTLRLSIPDLRCQVMKYIESNDADAFMTATELTRPRPKTWAQRLNVLFVGSRNHQWMYDGASLSRLVGRSGFVSMQILEAGKTTIEEPGPLDLHERSDESVYLEAKKP